MFGMYFKIVRLETLAVSNAMSYGVMKWVTYQVGIGR